MQTYHTYTHKERTHKGEMHMGWKGGRHRTHTRREIHKEETYTWRLKNMNGHTHERIYTREGYTHGRRETHIRRDIDTGEGIHSDKHTNWGTYGQEAHTRRDIHTGSLDVLPPDR